MRGLRSAVGVITLDQKYSGTKLTEERNAIFKPCDDVVHKSAKYNKKLSCCWDSWRYLLLLSLSLAYQRTAEQCRSMIRKTCR